MEYLGATVAVATERVAADVQVLCQVRTEVVDLAVAETELAEAVVRQVAAPDAVHSHRSRCRTHTMRSWTAVHHHRREYC